MQTFTDFYSFDHHIASKWLMLFTSGNFYKIKFFRAVDELIRVISNSNIAISVDEIEALVGAGTNDEDYSQLVEDIPEDKFEMEPSKRPIFPIPLDPVSISNFKQYALSLKF